jgi:riboflavin kinase / FMN adenylyltransferase
MEFVRGRHNLQPKHRGNVVTIGNFDGVHVGHREIIERVRARAREFDAPSTVVAFEPTFREFTNAATAPARLTSWREKYVALANLGVERFVTLRFDEAMRELTPENFVDEVLVKGLATRHLIVGHDFRFGHAAQGSVQDLQAIGGRHGFQVEVCAPVSVDGVRASSTVVRERLGTGDFPGAARILGRAYAMSGRVIHGRKLGRSLGFPTANIPIKRRRPAVWGIHAVRLFGTDGPALPGVASLGTRPTIAGVEPLLEVHVFDFDGELYGRYVQVEFVKKLRDEAAFPSLDSMVAQMRRDALQAREILL